MLDFWLIVVCAAAACGVGPECIHGSCTYGDGAYFCQCKRGWAGVDCSLPRAGFRKIPAGGQAPTDKAVNYACLVNGTECAGSKVGSDKCNYYAGVYSCEACPAGFVSYEGECFPQSCFNTNDYSGQEATKPPCNDRGRCLLKDPGLTGLDANDYMCSCYPIYRGKLCEICNDANAINVSLTTGGFECHARACQDQDGVVCSNNGKCVLDVGFDRESYHYRCACNDGYTRVGTKCVEKDCVATIDGSPVVCGGFGKCVNENNSGTFKCVCDKDAVEVGGSCTYHTCTDMQSTEICGGIGACVRDGVGYSCNCRDLAEGSLCQICIPEVSAQVGNKCIPLGCLTGSREDLCTSTTGTCIKFNGGYHCRCPDMLIAVDGQCTSPVCMDEELGKICSGHGTCDINNLVTNACACEAGYTYVAPGRCILSSLVDSSGKVCSGNGHVIFQPPGSSTMACDCSSIYEGIACADCNLQNAENINGECIAKRCIVESQPQPSGPPPPPPPSFSASIAVDSRICGGKGAYTIYGDPSNPFITCVPTDTTKVSAYNGTFSAEPGCVRVSKIDKTRRFYCGLLEGLTDSLDEVIGTIQCDVPSWSQDSKKMCTKCPPNFRAVRFDNKHMTCIHQDCHTGNPGSVLWSNYCGGVGDCVQKKDKSGYECDCGASATWDPALKTCKADTCKLDPKVAGPNAPEYCIKSYNSDLKCVVGQDSTWQCNCTGSGYVTYNKTCVRKEGYTNLDKRRVRGFCGGPGAGYIQENSRGQKVCICNPGFLNISNTCYSYDCLPVGVTPKDEKKLQVDKHVCSGHGTCVYNQLTGRYGCECDAGYEAFGSYCTYPECVGKGIHNGEIKYIECQVYDGSVGICTPPSGNKKASCRCGSSFKWQNGICVRTNCIINNKFCGGDLLALCIKGNNHLYSCACSEGYENGENRGECIPSRCAYVREADKNATICNRLGTCSDAQLLRDRTCNCDKWSQLVTIKDAIGVLRTTCFLSKCVSSKEGEPSVICGDAGRCESYGCECYTGYSLFGNTCVSDKCIINTVDDKGGMVASICGGESIGTCTKTGTTGTSEDYTCECNPGISGYKTVDGFCLPDSCIFKVLDSSTSTEIDTMCGGKEFGHCIINSNQPSSSHCICDDTTSVVQLDNKKCIKRACFSDVLPGNDFKYVECSGHGKCAINADSDYGCVCDPSYKTVIGIMDSYLCIPQVCVVAESDTSMICSGKGTCVIDQNICRCETGYAGDKCDNCDPSYKRYTDGNCYLNNCPIENNCGVIDGVSAGTCELENDNFVCICSNPDFVVDTTTKQCRKSRCVWTDPYDQTEKTCYGMGWCSDYGDSTGQCNCEHNTQLVNTNICVYSECISRAEDGSTSICRGHGVCIENYAGMGICRCDSQYRTDKKSGQCFAKECFGAPDDVSSEVCDGGGECNEQTKQCDCNVDGFQSITGQAGCVRSSCVSTNGKLCSGFGACENNNGHYECLCERYYTLVKKDCVATSCIKNGKVCNGGGKCTGDGLSAVCECNEGWTFLDDLCYPSVCASDGVLCGGYGKCVFDDGVTPTCVCNEGFSLIGDFVCGTPKKISPGITAAIAIITLLVIIGVASFLIWWFVIRPKGRSSKLKKIGKQLSSRSSLRIDAPLLSQSSGFGSSVQL